MSTSTMGTDAAVTAFKLITVQFPYETEKINTFEFLEASKDVVLMIGNTSF